MLTCKTHFELMNSRLLQELSYSFLQSHHHHVIEISWRKLVEIMYLGYPYWRIGESYTGMPRKHTSKEKKKKAEYLFCHSQTLNTFNILSFTRLRVANTLPATTWTAATALTDRWGSVELTASPASPAGPLEGTGRFAKLRVRTVGGDGSRRLTAAHLSDPLVPRRLLRYCHCHITPPCGTGCGRQLLPPPPPAVLGSPCWVLWACSPQDHAFLRSCRV